MHRKTARIWAAIVFVILVVGLSIVFGGGDRAVLIATLVSGGAALGAMGSALVSIQTLDRTRATVGAQTMFETYIGWDSPRLHGLRTRAAASLSNQLRHLTDSEWAEELKLPDDATDVLNYLELLGVLVCDANVIGIDQAWAAYTTYVLPWYFVCRPAIARNRLADDDPTLFASVERLYEALIAQDVKARTIAGKRVRRALAMKTNRDAKNQTGTDRRSGKDLAKKYFEEANGYTVTLDDVSPTIADIRDFLGWEATLQDDRKPIPTPLDHRSSIEVRMR